MMCTPAQAGGDGFGGGRFGGGGGFGGGGFGGGGFGGGGGGRFSLSIDEQTLRQVASITGAQYYRAQDAAQLDRVLLGLPKVITVQRQTVDLAVWFVLAGAALTMAAVGLSLWWNRGSPRRAA
jgi:Ca-activated chloride channel family protein